MKFENTSYFDPNRGKPDVKRDPTEFDENVETKLSWNLGSLAPEEIKSVIMGVNQKPDANNTQVAVRVEGKAIDGTRVSDVKNDADTRECSLRDDTGQPCYDETDTCKLLCPEWVYAFSP